MRSKALRALGREKVNCRFGKLEYEDFYLKNRDGGEGAGEAHEVAGGVRKRREKNYVVKHLARLDACNGCVVATMDTEAARDGQRQISLTTLCGRKLRRAVAGT